MDEQLKIELSKNDLQEAIWLFLQKNSWFLSKDSRPEISFRQNPDTGGISVTATQPL